MSRKILIAVAVFAIFNGIHGAGYYTIVGPQVLRANSEYHVTLNTFSLPEPVQINVQINGTDDAGIKFEKSQNVFMDSTDLKTIQFDIGDLKYGQYSLYAKDATGKIENMTNLDFNDKSFSVFIQSDKAIYKPADTVRFRVLILDANTRPYAYHGPLNIYVIDEKSNRVKQWLGVTTTKGVFSAELPLSDAPVLGNWKIQVEVEGKTETKTVEVAEYVLPKFEVTVDAPSHGVFKDGKVKATIRSKYTYGKPVKGEVTVSAYPTLFIGSVQPFINDAIARKVVPIDGKATVEFDIKEELKLAEEYERDIIFEAIVEEGLTGRKQNSTGKTTLHQQRHKIDFIKETDEYKPGLPFNAFVKVSMHDGTPIQDSKNPVTVSTNFWYDQSGNTNQTLTLDENGMARVDFDIPKNATSLSVSATYLGVQSYIGYISKASSESESYMVAQLETKQPQINKDVYIKVQTTEPVKEFSYQVLGRGDIITAGTIQVEKKANAVKQVQIFKFLATFAMVPTAQLVVFYVRPDGELVSDHLSIEFGSELQNHMKIELSKQQARPGEDIEITVDTNPNSYVGLLGVDQSVLLLKSGNDLSKDQVFDELKKYDSGPSRYRPWRFRRSSYYPWQRDRYEKFENAGLAILTNTKGTVQRHYPLLASASFGGGRPQAGVANRVQIVSLPSPTSVTIRKEFPESWIWEDVKDFQGRTTLSKKVPDTITSWVITGFAVDPLTGLGLTQRPRNLKVFQPFFVSLNLPYSVKREEIVSIPIVVFNYMEQDQEAEVTLHNAENEFEFVEPSNDVNEVTGSEPMRSKRVAVKSNSGSSVSFMVKPKKVGHITIKVVAQGSSAGDGVERQLLVVPEGVTQFVNEAVLVDLRDSGDFFKNLSVVLPKNIVPDSARIEVSVIGDLLGSTIKNLDKLIQMPYGCGEQNMLNFVPNIVVLDYLTQINQLTPEIEGKAKKFMEAGYQRELTYKHGDGSFSAFGESDKNGSTWLTAFVARSFHQAQKYIDVERDVIKNALNFLVDVQAANGSFPEIGQVSHKDMQGGSGNGLALTAYTLVTFLENKDEFPEFQNAISKAMDYLVKNIETLEDNYAIAIAAYALQLAGHNAKDFVLTRLDSRATTDGDTKYWHKPIPASEEKNPWYSRPNSVNVEMTAYGLLAFVAAGQETAAFPILKWLIGQRNENGGFQSTQDTVVGLQALAKLAGRLGSGTTNAALKVSYDDGKEANMNVDGMNAFVLQSYLLPNTVRNVNISASGRGVAVAQLSYRYNVNVTGEWPRFTLDPQVNKNSNADHLHLTVCTTFVPADGVEESNMAVMEVEFPSGMTVDPDILPSLENYQNVKRVETKNGDSVVVLYFDSLDRKESCPTLGAFRTHKVANQKPAAVRVYDYYDNAKQARMFYSVPESSVCDICEGDSCAEKCTPKAQAQQSGNATTGGAQFKSNEPNAATTNSITSLVILSITFILSQFL